MNDDDNPTIAVGVRCIRCAGTSTIPFGDPDEVRDDHQWACPHCHDTGHDRRLGDDYDVTGVAVTTVMFDVTDDVDDFPSDVLTDVQEEDFAGVVVDGKTTVEQGYDRDVRHGTVSNNVARARRKIRATA